jgi:putative cell wall-binding protein
MPMTFPGTNGSMTISRGDNVLHFANGVTSRPMPSTKVTDAEWSPDGSRVAYLDENNDLVTVRGDGTDKIVIAPALAGATHPTWMLNGSFLVYALNGDLYKVPSLGGTAPVKLAAGHQAGDVDGAPQGGPGGLMVFQRKTSVGNTSVWIFDAVAGTSKGLNHLGFSPSISPDGKTVAFVLPDSSATPINQIWTIGSDGNNATQLTHDTATNQNSDTPAWSPDGAQIAFNAGGDVRSMAPTVNAPEPVVASAITGRISWQPNGNNGASPSTTNPVNLVERLDGADRIATAIQVSHWTWADQATNPPPEHQAKVVVLARSDIFADALAGSALAAFLHGPLLLTHTANLDQSTLDEMRRILKPGSFVYVLGLDKAISLGTEAQVNAAGFLGTRIGGEDRFETAVDIAKWIVPDYSTKPVTILTATGMNFPDALAAGAVAGSRPNTVVVLTNDKTMPVNTLGFINSVPQRTVFAIGGAAVTALQSVNVPTTPVSGNDRFITASMVAHQFFGSPQVVGIATGYNFPDALAGGALAGSAGGPLLLTGPTLLPTQTADYLRTASGSISDAVMFGGPAVLADGLKNQIGDLIGQPGQWVYTENDPAKHVGPLVAAP